MYQRISDVGHSYSANKYCLHSNSNAHSHSTCRSSCSFCFHRRGLPMTMKGSSNSSTRRCRRCLASTCDRAVLLPQFVCVFLCVFLSLCRDYLIWRSAILGRQHLWWLSLFLLLLAANSSSNGLIFELWVGKANRGATLAARSGGGLHLNR